MEKLHKPENRPWISELIDLKKFRDDWGCAGIHHSSNLSKLSTEELKKIETECSLDELKCPLQDVEVCNETTIPLNLNLETLRLQKEELERRKRDAHYNGLITRDSRKYYNYPPIKIFSEECNSELKFKEVKTPEVVLSIQIFRPEKKVSIFQRNATNRIPGFTIDQEFMVLGSQCLTELRDKIVCVSDEAVLGEYSDHPQLPPETRAKDAYKSGFFYINGTFYNDIRHSDNRDYSENIIKWAENEKNRIGPFNKCSMKCTHFIDLKIKLGYPYVYVHQGNCEHLMVFSDVLMHTPHHNTNRNAYPLNVVLKVKKRALCMVCQTYTAQWIVHNNKWLPENPYFMCKECFISFNYDENNTKMCDIKAYHYTTL